MDTMFNSVLLAFVFSGFISVNSQYAYDDNQPMKDELRAILAECGKEYPLPPVITNKILKGDLPNHEAAKCFFACTYKKTGMLDDNGMLSVDQVNLLNMKVFANDPIRRNSAMALTEACEYVNQIPVKDGARGCDRAELIFKCTVKNAKQYGLV